jgi:HSP20 family protein
MSTVRELIPKKGEKLRRDVPRTMWPFGRGMEDVFENIFRNPLAEPWGFRRPMFRDFEALDVGLPPIDLIDHENELVLRAELPGVKKDEIDLTLTNDSLAIVVERKAKEEHKEDRFYRTELSSQSMARTIYFPVEVDSDKAKAHLEDGILEIVVPKLMKVKRRTVKVQ